MPGGVEPGWVWTSDDRARRVCIAAGLPEVERDLFGIPADAPADLLNVLRKALLGLHFVEVE